MTGEDVFLGLGSNQGNRAGLLDQASALIGEMAGEVLAESSLYETEPWQMAQAGLFLNRVIRIRTTREPDELLEVLLTIERMLGRDRGSRQPGIYRSRLLDIDILFYGERIIRTGELKIPHPLLAERRFVLVPLAEIAGSLRHPLLGISVSDLLARCGDTCAVTIYSRSL